MNLCRNYIREKSQAPVLQEEPDRPAPHTLAGASPERSLTLWDLDLILEELSPSRHDGAPLWVLSKPVE